MFSGLTNLIKKLAPERLNVYNKSIEKYSKHQPGKDFHHMQAILKQLFDTTNQDRVFATVKAINRKCSPYLFKANWS